MYLKPQIKGLAPDTEIVKLTAGGNDVKYIGDLFPLAYKNRPGVSGFLMRIFFRKPKLVEYRDFLRFRTDLLATLTAIHQRSPRARIFVVTYPAVLPVTGLCSRLGLTLEQVTLMRAVADKLADVTRSAAQEANAELIDMATLSVRNDVCSAEPWVNGTSLYISLGSSSIS